MREHDWWGKLVTYLNENRSRGREYGTWDCWQFVAGAVLVMTSVDHRLRFPSYTSLEEGLAILSSLGGEEVFLNELFGEKKHPAFAQRGDILLADLGEGLAGCICIGVEMMTVSPTGLETVATLSGTAAWTV